MATIRSYTTIEQSRKLAEILPIESANMYWKNGVSDKYIQCFTPFVIDDYRSNVDYDYDVPCWSLAALLDVLPNDTSLLYFDDTYQMVYDKKPYVISNKFDNPVDACVEMIEHLHELKML